MSNNKIFSLAAFIVVFLFPLILYAQTDDNEAAKEVKKMFIPEVKIHPSANEISQMKALAAINYAVGLTKSLTLCSDSSRDSAIAQIKQENGSPTAIEVAKRLKADELIFINISLFKNLLRVEIVAVESATLSKSVGIGWASIRFRKVEDEAKVYDPDLLKATQRALAAALKDSSLYAHCEGSFKVTPVSPLVIGGLEYKTSPYSNEWDLFRDRLISSYFAVETIHSVAVKSGKFETVDTETRDSVFAAANLMLIENCNAPSVFELKALEAFGLEFYISGSFARTTEGAELELTLNRIVKGKLLQLNKCGGVLEKDSNKEFETLLKDLTTKLLDLN
jgi:hypothetical protein